MQLQLLAAAIATNGVPTLATHGAAVQLQRSHTPATHDRMLVSVFSTAGSATMTVTIRLWGYASFTTPAGVTTSKWLPVWVNEPAQPDAVTEAKRGVLNAGIAIGEIGTDTLEFSQEVSGLRHFTRLYAEVVTIGGTNTAVDVWVTDRA